MALNDIGILGSIILFFLVSATFIPLVQSGFSGTSTEYDVENYEEGVIDEGTELTLSPLSFFGVFTNVFKLAYVGVSGLPFWLDLLYTFFSIMFVLLLAKFIPTIGSGG